MVYDCLYCTVNSFVERQIALLNTNCKEIDLRALALGHAPEAFHFKQDSVRQHLRECFEHGVITMFP